MAEFDSSVAQLLNPESTGSEHACRVTDKRPGQVGLDPPHIEGRMLADGHSDLVGICLEPILDASGEEVEVTEDWFGEAM
jgi:hypothetical protein